MLSAAQYRAQTQTLHSQEMKIAYSDNTLKQYIPRIAEFVEFVFRRYSAGPTFPLCTVEHIDAFFQFFVTRGKFRSSVMHAHNRTTTASMLAEHVKAINKFAEWERSDPVWVGIVNNNFPLDFAWPIGWLPLTNGKYAPATGEITQRPMTYLRRKQGEEINASHLPHPDMLMVMSTVSREDFRTMLVNHMNKDDSEQCREYNPSAGNTTWWHCTFADMQRQDGRGVRFWLHASGGHGDLAKLHSNTKTYLDIICSSSRVSASITADSIFKHLFSGNTTGLITETEYSALHDAADDLDVQFVKDDRHWESFVQTQRDNVLHRSKRTKRA